MKTKFAISNEIRAGMATDDSILMSDIILDTVERL